MSKRPICPECNESMTFLQSTLKTLTRGTTNAQTVKENCIAPKLWKSITIACFIMGFCAGIFASYKEEQGAWTANTSWLILRPLSFGIDSDNHHYMDSPKVQIAKRQMRTIDINR